MLETIAYQCAIICASSMTFVLFVNKRLTLGLLLKSVLRDEQNSLIGHYIQVVAWFSGKSATPYP
jgi:hypothetical protein